MWISNAFIERISNERDTILATVVYRENPRSREQTVRLVVSRQTKITDMNGRRLRPSDLEVGMVIDAFISTAMTRSIPPQAEAFEIIVVGRRATIQESVGRIVQVDTRNNFIIVATSDHNFNIIRFNVGPETVILDLLGRRIRLGELFPGLRVRVEHATFMTASIPPQTIAFVIRVIR
ncbi:hypothetical protein [Anaerosporobacter sp.]|uniref:hypothetical protein n=1 Tax=Anaerosporobacter sp. TaxID=1872529 RepID=UPI00286F3317|nr:hypothetical protein [Anaerosporobacter sp.]